MADRALRPGDYATWAVLGLGAVIMLLPFVWMVSTSLKTGDATFVMPPQLIPSAPTLANYSKIFAAVPMAHAGTTVIRGRGQGLVVATGATTQVGRLAAAMSATAGGKPPLCGHAPAPDFVAHGGDV